MHAVVEKVERLSPSMVRLVLGGEGLADFEMPEDTDTYLNLAIPPAGAPYSGLFDIDAVKAAHGPERQPARRRYTVRTWDAETRRLTLDFVVHGDEGVAGPWAAAVGEGDVLVFTGPGSGYRPDPAAAWHLMVGDESAIPAIAASLEVLEPSARAVVVLVVDGPEHELELASPATVELTWLHRRGEADDVHLLAEAVRSLAFPEGRVQAFVHGEAEEIRAVRMHLLAERGLERRDMSCSPYWRRTMTDEAWRQVKKDFVQAMNADAPA